VTRMVAPAAPAPSGARRAASGGLSGAGASGARGREPPGERGSAAKACENDTRSSHNGFCVCGAVRERCCGDTQCAFAAMSLALAREERV